MIGLSGAQMRALGTADLRVVVRESFLRFILVYPLVLTLLARFLIPGAAERVAERVDLVAYYPLLLAYLFILNIPLAFGVILGLILLDEKDEDTLTALRITPVPLRSYLGFRLFAPFALAFGYSLICIWLVGLMPDLVSPAALMPALPVAALSALEAPMFALFLSAFAKNKVEGLAVMKGAGIFMIAPLIEWFFNSPWTWLLGLIPTYWPVTALWEYTQHGDMGAAYWGRLGIGLALHLLILAWLIRRFQRGLEA